jgi:hypothetical protein
MPLLPCFCFAAGYIRAPGLSSGQLQSSVVAPAAAARADTKTRLRPRISGCWPVQREFIRRMKRRFQERGSEIASAAHTIVMQIAAQFDVISLPAMPTSCRLPAPNALRGC